MDRQLIEVVIIDELINKLLKEQKHILTETQLDLVNESVNSLMEAAFGIKEAEDEEVEALPGEEGEGPVQDVDPADILSDEPAAAPGTPAAGPGRPPMPPGAVEDETPGRLDPEERREAGEAQSDLIRTLKKRGLVGSAVGAVMGVAKKVFTALFGQGVFQRKEDAENLIRQVRTGNTPAEVAARLYQQLYRFQGPAGAPGPGGPPGPTGPDGGPGAPEEPGEKAPGSEFAVPVFKKFSGADQEKGAHPRSLSSQLMKLFPNVPKSAITQILKGVAGQLKASKVPIQENKNIIAKAIIQEINNNILFEGRLERGEVSAEEVANQEAGEILQKTDKYLDSLETKEEVEEFKIAVEQGELPPDKIEGAESGRLNKGGANKIRTYYTEHGGKDKIQDKLESLSGPNLLDKFKDTLKQLDLDTREGREAAKNTDEAYLGAYKFYKAMKLAYSGVRTGRLEDRTERIEKLLTPLNEAEDEKSPTDIKLSMWLRETIKEFEEAGLDDRERGMQASKAARGATDPKEKGYEPAKVRSASGTVNTRQSVGPQLKAAGVDIKSPEGQALQKKMLKVIRRFLNKNMQRMGKQEDIKIISEKLIKELRKRGIIK